MEDQPVAVFDFDGTIVSKIIAYEFYKWLIKKSLIRIILFFLLLPVTSILITNSLTRKYGFTIISFTATALQSQSLFRMRSDFIKFYFTESGAIVFKDAIDKINQHHNKNENVLILSGCPLWLLRGITKYLGIKNVELVGSEVKLSMTGLLFKNHCFSTKKISIAKKSGYKPDKWHYGYSDSVSDIPWLKHCKQIHAINLSKKELSIFNKSLKGKIRTEKWAQ